MRARTVARTDVFRVRTREAGRASRAGRKWNAIEAQFVFLLFSLVDERESKGFSSANWRENGSFTLWVWGSSHKKLKYRSTAPFGNTVERRHP